MMKPCLTRLLLVIVALTTTSLLACSSSNARSASGGSSGGQAILSGGVSAGGTTSTPTSTAGTLPSAGTSAAGGQPQAGSLAQGGSDTGGAATSAAGRTAAGGSLAGSSAAGGATGGSETGGSAAAGSVAGGSKAGGSVVGGTTTGGSAAGGTTTGGSVAGGSKASSSSGGASSSGGSGATSVTGPCDIFEAGSTPCVAAHSTVRALFGAFNSSLYQVKRASDNTTKDIGVLTAGGFADSAAQDTFCTGTTCIISIIYDQSGKNNHLGQAPLGQRNKTTAPQEADATALPFTISGHTVYGVHLPVGYGYRIDKTAGVATGDDPETMYMVTSGTFVNSSCCFDYGNAETDNRADGDGTMEAVYFGTLLYEGKGVGAGPWVLADFEGGVFAQGSLAENAAETSQTSTYVTAMLIGRSGTFALKGGDAQTATLTTFYDGARPTGFNPMKKQGSIVLGTGGDGTDTSQGDFYEGVMTSGAASDATASAVQANIAAAGYGK